MEETPTTTVPAEPAVIKPMSFTEKLTNVFTAPGELFDNVRDTPPTASNWLVPLAIFIVIAIAMQQIIFHNPALVDQLKVQMTQKMEKQFDEQIKAGKMSPEEATRAREQAESITNPASPFFIALTIGSLLIFTPLVLFAIALVYWLMGKSIMKAQAPYMKVVEVIGLVLFIGILESIVTTIMSVGLENLHATPSLGLAVLSDFSTDNKLHMLLSKVNVFTIWSLIVTSIGLGHLFRRDVPKVMALVFALWVLWIVFALLTGISFS